MGHFVKTNLKQVTDQYAGLADAFGTNTQNVIDYEAGGMASSKPMMPEAVQSIRSSYKYPLVNSDQYKGRISFQAYRVIPPGKDTGSFNVKDISSIVKKVQESSATLANFVTRDRNTTTVIDYKDGVSNQVTSALQDQKVADARNSKNKSFNQLRKDMLPGEKCELYLPLSYVVNDNMNYNTPDLGVFGGAIASAIAGGGGIAQSLQQGINDAGRSFFDFFKNGSVDADLARLAVVRSLNTLRIGDTVKNAISLAGQVTVNPNTRALFDRVVLREFTFQFKFIPKSREESAQVANIIKFFRSHTYPTSIPENGLPIGYRFPDLFRISLQYDKQQVGTKIKDCYLRNISTNYNPGQASFHRGGDGRGKAAPVETDLSLTFVEEKTLTRSDIEDNY